MPEKDQHDTKHVSLLCDSAVPPVIVKEWCASKAKSALTPELVPALCFREWTCPNLRRLWLGRASEDRSRRTRAFLACMRSDCPALLNPTCVPSHLLLMCCVLRYHCQMTSLWGCFSLDTYVVLTWIHCWSQIDQSNIGRCEQYCVCLQVYDAVAGGSHSSAPWAWCLFGSGCVQPALWAWPTSGTQGTSCLINGCHIKASSGIGLIFFFVAQLCCSFVFFINITVIILVLIQKKM